MHSELPNIKTYIENCWNELTVRSDETETHLFLPNPIIAPSVHRIKGFVFAEQFYWDTYFTIIGLVIAGRKEMATGMVDNLLYMVDHLGYVPNSNNRVHLGRSQPPFLSSMVLLIYKQNNDYAWLQKAYQTVSKEYYEVWTSNKHPHNRKVYKGLSRYYHQDQSHRGAEDESGWDYTDRFEDRALDFLPIDLNCYLYKYEQDLAKIADILNLHSQAETWRKKAEKRKTTINELMWDEESGFYYDYDYTKQKRGNVASLAAYTALFSGLADKKQASKLVSKLSLFETKYGLTTTPKNNQPIDKKQWTAPNGWAPLHFLVNEGLELYGYKQKAKEIRHSWINTVETIYNKTGLIFEKYNMVDLKTPPTSAVYPDQYGFGWSNAITLYFMMYESK
jgi:alpha,alpha-trehalase